MIVTSIEFKVAGSPGQVKLLCQRNGALKRGGRGKGKQWKKRENVCVFHHCRHAMELKYTKFKTITMKFASSFFFSVKSAIYSGVWWQKVENISLLIIPSNIPNTFDSSMMRELSDLHLFLHFANGWHNVLINYKAKLAQSQGEKQLPPCHRSQQSNTLSNIRKWAWCRIQYNSNCMLFYRL